MCNKYPNCQHSGPLHDEIEGIPRHCETLLPNSECYYHRLGCLGCTFNITGPRNPINATIGSISMPLHLRTPVDWAAQVEAMKRSFEITLHPTYINQDALLALVAGVWRSYCMLQGLVNAGIVTPEWASKSLENAVQYTYRQAVCRLVAAYLDTRSKPE